MLSAFDPWKRIGQISENFSDSIVGSMSHKTQLPSRRIPLASLVHTAGSTGGLEDLDSAARGFGFFKQPPPSQDPFPSFGPYWILRDPYLHDQYTAECMVSLAISLKCAKKERSRCTDSFRWSQVSQTFQERLGELYDPIECWTSSLRSRSGLPDYVGHDGAAPFTMRGSNLSKAMFRLLLHSSYRHAAPFSRKRFCTDTVYHCEVFMTAGDSNDWFSLNHTTLHKVCRSQMHLLDFSFSFPTH